MENCYGVIMAGGGGTRLWPLSRRGRPKQTLALFGKRSLFQIAVERVRPLLPPERLRVVTVAEQLRLLREQAPELPASSFVLEPAPRGTAAVVGLAAVSLIAQDSSAIMIVLTADHYIKDEELFRELLVAGVQTAEAGHLVTLGIRPAKPSTGYGYLRLGEQLSEVRGKPIHRVDSFREKPDAQTAAEYVASGDYLWNSGMFIWRVDRIMGAIREHMPELAAGLERIRESLGSGNERQQTEAVWRDLRPETIDYGVMEKADDVVVVPAEGMGWWDVGSWDRLFELMETDGQGNLVIAPSAVAVDTSGTLIVQEEELAGARIVATLGVQDLVIIDTGPALLVATREQAERVRSIVDLLENEGYEQYL